MSQTSGSKPRDVAKEAVERRRRAGTFYRVCQGPACTESGSKAVAISLRALLNTCQDVSCGCLGECGRGPNVAASDGERQWKEFGVSGTADLAVLLSPGSFDSRVMHVCQTKEEAARLLKSGKAEQAASVYSAAISGLQECGKVGDSWSSEGTKMLYQSLLLNRSLAWAETDEWEAMLRDSNASIDIYAANSKAWMRKAEAHTMLGEHDLAQSALSMANRLAPGSTKANREKIERLLGKSGRHGLFGRLFRS